VVVASAAAWMLSLALLGVVPAAGQQAIACGDSVAGSLSGGSDVYQLTVTAGAVGFLQASVTGGEIDSLRLRITGPGVNIDTCRNVAKFDSLGGRYRVEVSSCFGGEGVYLLSTHIVSDSGDNCGPLLRCGTTDDGVALTRFGEVDSYRFPGLPGEFVDIRVNGIDDSAAPYLVRVSDPDGVLVSEVCGEFLTVSTASAGMYTVLVSACGDLGVGRYRLERFDRRCPEGPSITAFAFLPVDRAAVLPADFDAAGRPVYESGGTGTLIVEGRVGASLREVGASAFERDRLPDFQAIVSRPLGDGNPLVCDQGEIPPGGIPATVPFAFRDDAASVDRINDLGCRINDGAGDTVGRPDPLNSCVRFSFAFEDPTTDIQFCADLASAEIFPPGDTIVAARLRDRSGNLGAKREIVVRVERSVLPTRTATATVRPTATPTRLPTKPLPTRPAGPCTCDCNDDGEVRVDELTRGVLIALERRPLGICSRADRNGDGKVSVAELVEGVNNALVGCPPVPIAR